MKLGLTKTLFLGCILQVMILSQVQGSLIPFSDPLVPANLWLDSFPDPLRVLEQIPLALEREESKAVLPSSKVDWKETPGSHVIMLDVPGMKKEELKIEVEENRVLLISGERRREEDNKSDHWHRSEISYGKFWRRFRLPENVNLDRVEAKLENGVLVISMPKLSPDKIKGPKVVEIAGKGESSPDKLTASERKEEL